MNRIGEVTLATPTPTATQERGQEQSQLSPSPLPSLKLAPTTFRPAKEHVNGSTYITMEGGLQLATAYEYLFKKHNLLIPGGSCWAVCAGGHVTGGGYGIYSVDHGTTCDYLAGVHFACVCAPPPHPTDPDAHSSARAVHTGVDSTGKVRETHAWANSPEYELRQLLWACRGAMVRCLLSPHTLWRVSE